ncbi:MAG: N-acetylglucosamine-6-phosphate deacetylase [Vicinamibacterales bacterium]
MIRLAGATIVQPHGILEPGTLTIEGDRITDITSGDADGEGRNLRGHLIVPGFIDVHVHGVRGIDVLDGGDAIARMARLLPEYGVTSFCPTSIACPPEDLRLMLSAVRAVRQKREETSARVLPAHLESNFISAAFKGAQPESCIRAPRQHVDGDFSGPDVLAEIARAREEVGIVTVAPEIDGVLDLIPILVSDGHRVSLGHSGATYEQARAGIAAGARHGTHLFNRMSAFTHRAPGLTGAILESSQVAAELICDGVHVHPAAVRAAVGAKGCGRVMAITDGTAGSGLQRGTRARLGGRSITVGDASYLDDGTIAGSVLTMDRAFSSLVTAMGFNPVDAARMCSTTPAGELGLSGYGALVTGGSADLVVLDYDFRVVETYIAGVLVYPREAGKPGTALEPGPSMDV